MKYIDLKDYINNHNLLKNNVKKETGIYGITIDNIIVYIGESKNVYDRCCQHIYEIENAMLNKEKKYLLLLSAKLGGHNIDCVGLDYGNYNELELKKAQYNLIKLLNTPLNKESPNDENSVYFLKIENLINYVKYKKEEMFKEIFKA